MSRLWERVSFGADGPRVGRAGVAVAEVIGRLEADEPWGAIADGLGLETADLVAAVAVDGLGDDEALGPTLIQTNPKRPKLRQALEEPALKAAGIGRDRAARLALAAGLLQVQDFWGASHEAAQAADDQGERATSAYWHGIGHRREPDYGNAAYWFRRVGRHAIFDDLAREAAAIVGKAGPPEAAVLATAWNPLVIADLARGGLGETLARRLQRAEMMRLLEASAEAVGLS